MFGDRGLDSQYYMRQFSYGKHGYGGFPEIVPHFLRNYIGGRQSRNNINDGNAIHTAHGIMKRGHVFESNKRNKKSLVRIKLTTTIQHSRRMAVLLLVHLYGLRINLLEIGVGESLCKTLLL